MINKFLYDAFLLIKAIPGVFMSNKGNAQYHLKHVCPSCPKWRRKLRYVYGNKCFWENNWEHGNYQIPRAWVGGIKNLSNVLFFHKIDFSKFRKELHIKEKQGFKFLK